MEKENLNEKSRSLEKKRQFKLKKVYPKSDMICQNFSAVQHSMY